MQNSILRSKIANSFNQARKIRIENLKNIIQKRVELVANDESVSTLTNVTNLLNRWTKEIKRYGQILRYKEPFHPSLSEKLLERHMYLLQSDPTSSRQLIPTPTSLRNTEQEQNFWYVDSDTDFDKEESK